MLRQIGLLQSGAQTTALNSTLHFSEDRIIYASSLAVYILNSETYLVEKILCTNQKSITSLSISQIDKNLLIVGSVEGIITVWNIEEETVIRRIAVSFPVTVAWDPFSPNICHTLALDNVRLYSWDITTTDGTLTELLKVRSDTLKATMMRGNPKVPGLIAVGCNAGTTILFQASDKSTKLLSNSDKKLQVEDLQWDRLSTSYLLVAYRSHIELWDTESAALVHSFDKQPMAIHGIAWMDWTAGNFVSFNNKNNNLKVWNASQKHPIENIKIRGGGDGGLTAISFNSAKKHAFMACVDGSIVVYDVPSARVVHRTPAGHTETIFGCEFCPTNPYLFATCSYDATVKLWNVHDFSLQRTLYCLEGIIYALAWSPSGKLIAAGTSLGELVIWDTENGHELARYKQSSKQLYFVHWNPQDEHILLNSTGDGNAIVMEIDVDFIRDPANNPASLGSRRRGAAQSASNSEHFAQPVSRRTIAHPATVYGVSWAPFQKTIFATCCHDGLVRIFNYAMMGELLYTLRGHNARVFNVEWSPLVPGLLATSSDDRMILTWNIQDNVTNVGTKPTSGNSAANNMTPKKSLQGHSNNVRALCWSRELSQILLSGSWDCTMRIWNVETGSCLAVIRDHNADVYSISSHPQMPFTFLSSSRDNTVRLWELGGLTKLMRYYAIWDGNFSRLLSKAGDDTESDAENAVFSFLRSANSNKLVGGESKQAESKTGDVISDPRFMMRPTLVGTESLKLHRSLTDGDGNELKDLIGHARDAYEDNSGRPPRRNGGRLERNLPTEPLRLAHDYYKIFTYFNGSSGVMDIWENAITILENQKSIRSSFFQAITSSSAWLRPTALRQVLHESEVLGQSQLEARKLATQTRVSLKKSDNSAEDNQLAAALAYMRMGEFSKYCAIMVELGKWESALAVAPSVSLEYWKYLSFQYALYLKEQSSEMAIPHLLCIGKDADAVDYYLHRADPQSAMTIAKMSEQRTDVIPDLTTNGDPMFLNSGGGNQIDVTLTLPRGRYGNNNNNATTNSGMSSPMRGGLTRQSHHTNSLTTLDAINIVMSEASPVNHSARERTERETEDSRKLVRSVAQQASRRMLKLAQPLLAAAHLLSVENVHACIDVLMINHEPDLAYALAKCFKLDVTKIAIIWADQCAAFGALDLALEILEEVRYDQQQSLLQQHSQRAYASAQHSPQKLPPMNPSAGIGGGRTFNGDEEIALLLSKYAPSDQFAEEYLHQRPFLLNCSMNQVLDKAKEDEAIGQDGDAITGYVTARAFTPAAELGLRACKRMLNDAFNLTSNGKRILHALQHVRVLALEDRELRLSFLCYMLWFSAHRAARKGAFHAAHTMLNILLDYAPRTNPVFPVPAASIQYQMLFFMIYAGDQSAYSLLNTILSTELPSGQIREGLRALNALLREEKGWNHWISRLAVKWNRMSSTNNGYHPAYSTVASTAVNSAVVSPRMMTKMPSISSGLDSSNNNAGGAYSTGETSLLSPNAKGGKLVHTNSFGESMLSSAMVSSMGGTQNDVTLNLIVSVIGEIHKLTDSLQLPALTRLTRARPSSNSSSNHTNNMGSANGGSNNAIDHILDLLLAPQPVIQGSLLPVSNLQLKLYQSCVNNQRRIQGRSYELEDHASYMSMSEAANWLRFHGFSPLMTGECLAPLT